MQNKNEYWYISDKGDLAIDIDENKYKDRFESKLEITLNLSMMLTNT